MMLMISANKYFVCCANKQKAEEEEEEEGGAKGEWNKKRSKCESGNRGNNTCNTCNTRQSPCCLQLNHSRCKLAPTHSHLRIFADDRVATSSLLVEWVFLSWFCFSAAENELSGLNGNIARCFSCFSYANAKREKEGMGMGKGEWVRRIHVHNKCGRNVNKTKATTTKIKLTKNGLYTKRKKKTEKEKRDERKEKRDRHSYKSCSQLPSRSSLVHFVPVSFLCLTLADLVLHLQQQLFFFFFFFF